MIRDGHAYIMPNRCILCGQCLLNCPQSAKRVPSELSKVKKLIESGAPVIASLSSSYMGAVSYTHLEGKEDPTDFVLWKPKKEGEPFWESPWCQGRPGWHIERCV